MRQQPKTMIRTRLVKGDSVRVMSGRERGKEGRVIRVLRETGKIVVEGLNLVKKCTKPSPRNQTGGILEKEAPIAISNVRVVCGHCNKPTRIRAQQLADGKKIRVCQSCGDALGKAG
jgi:large subunit ribosomal protein L24